MIYAYSEKFMLVLSHDEVVHGKGTLLAKMPGERKDQFANMRLTYGYHMTHPGKKLIFMGQDIGEYDEFAETRPVEWSLLENGENKGLNRLIEDMNKLYTSKPALYQMDTSWEGFEWINCITPEKCMLSYLRKASKKEDMLVVVANFANVEQTFKVGVPYEGKYQEIINTDAVCYGGSGRVNAEVCHTTEGEWDGKPYAITMKAAPLSLSIFSYCAYTREEKAEIKRKRLEEEKRLREAEERRIAQEEAERAAQAAEEARIQAKCAVEEAKELARRAADEAKRQQKHVEELEKKAQKAAKDYEELNAKHEKKSGRKES